MMGDVLWLLDPIRRVHERVVDAVVAACEQSPIHELSQIDHESPGDTIYAIDRVGEAALVECFEREVTAGPPMILIAEGLAGGRVVLPRGAAESDAVFRVIADPIDGTRLLMYQKRSAWVLTGVAPNRGPDTRLPDIELAVQTEIPLVKQHLADALWAARGQGARAERVNRLTGQCRPLVVQPSRADTILGGFAMVARFFPGARDELAAIDEEIVRGALGPPRAGQAQCFEEQYASTGGQLYELMVGHDRFVADLRALVSSVHAPRGVVRGHCCHPYDLCTELIAREAGVLVTSPGGGAVDAPLDLVSDVAWAGYANQQVRARIEPLLRAALESRGLLDRRG
jgi:fructose-1,6-bisphosphatase/inositol monophosphatase family enzyme